MQPHDDPERWIPWARAGVVAAVTGKAPGVAPPGRPPAPRTPSLDRAIAAVHDSRYRPLRPADFAVTVTLVERLEPLAGVDGLGAEDGLVLTAGFRTGVVPPWEGRDPKTRLAWAYRKAGVARGASVRLQRLVGVRARG